MAVKLKIKNSPNKKEPPKREPIVVSDINDPRLKAYQDSLSLHKLGEAELRRFFNGDPGESRGKIRSLQDLNKGTKTYSGEIPKNQLYNTDRDALNSNRNVQKISKNPKPWVGPGGLLYLGSKEGFNWVC